MAENATTIENYLLYKGRPLVRKDQTLIYGSFKEKAYADMVILSEKEELAEDGSKHTVPDMIMVTILSTDKNVTAPLRTQEFKTGLYSALEYSSEQIDRFNKK